MTPQREHRAAAIVAAALILAACAAGTTGGPDSAGTMLWPILAGAFATFLLRHKFRLLGLLPPALTLVAGCGPFLDDAVPGILFCLALGAGLAAWLRSWAWLPPGVPVGWYWVPAAAVAGGWAAYLVTPVAAVPFAVPAAVAAAVAFAWVSLFRAFFELCVAPPLWLSYKIRGTGPGLADFPRTGPVIVLANHSCWWDPLFITKVLPRPITAMMTSKFYDVKVLTPLFKYVFGAIRVPDVSARRDAPELADAVAAIDAGRVLVLFPEGSLRRREDQPLRRFGRGVWEILKARPDTPVVACWIAGNWGSWPSYRNGPPTKGKKPDVRRRVAVGVSAPEVVPADALENHLATRFLLMRRVAAAAAFAGEPVPVVDTLPADDAA